MDSWWVNNPSRLIAIKRLNSQLPGVDPKELELKETSYFGRLKFYSALHKLANDVRNYNMRKEDVDILIRSNLTILLSRVETMHFVLSNKADLMRNKSSTPIDIDERKLELYWIWRVYHLTLKASVDLDSLVRYLESGVKFDQPLNHRVQLGIIIKMLAVLYERNVEIFMAAAMESPSKDLFSLIPIEDNSEDNRKLSQELNMFEFIEIEKELGGLEKGESVANAIHADRLIDKLEVLEKKVEHVSPGLYDFPKEDTRVVAIEHSVNESFVSTERDIVESVVDSNKFTLQESMGQDLSSMPVLLASLPAPIIIDHTDMGRPIKSSFLSTRVESYKEDPVGNTVVTLQINYPLGIGYVYSYGGMLKTDTPITKFGISLDWITLDPKPPYVRCCITIGDVFKRFFPFQSSRYKTLLWFNCDIPIGEFSLNLRVESNVQLLCGSSLHFPPDTFEKTNMAVDGFLAGRDDIESLDVVSSKEEFVKYKHRLAGMFFSEKISIGYFKYGDSSSKILLISKSTWDFIFGGKYSASRVRKRMRVLGFYALSMVLSNGKVYLNKESAGYDLLYSFGEVFPDLLLDAPINIEPIHFKKSILDDKILWVMDQFSQYKRWTKSYSREAFKTHLYRLEFGTATCVDSRAKYELDASFNVFIQYCYE